MKIQVVYGNFTVYTGRVKGLCMNHPRLSASNQMEECINSIHRRSFMSAHVLLNLLNELGKRDTDDIPQKMF